MTPRYFGPCRAGLHPEFGWGQPCMNDASEYVEIHATHTLDVNVSTMMRLCANHATLAEKVPGFYSRKPLGPSALTYPRPA